MCVSKMNEIANNCWEEDHNFNCDRKKSFIGKACPFLGKSKKLYIL